MALGYGKGTKTRFASHIIVWSTVDGAVRSTIEIGETGGFFEVISGGVLACPGPKYSVDLYDLATKKLLHRFSGLHTQRLTQMAANRDGSLLVVCDHHLGLVVYDLKSKSARFQVEGWQGGSMAFTPDGLPAVAVEGVSFFQVGEKELRPFARGESGISRPVDISFAGDASHVLGVGAVEKKRADLLAIRRSQEQRTIAVAEEMIRAVAASRDGKWLAWAEEKSLSLYSTAAGKTVGSVELEKEPTDDRALEFSPDGARLIARLGRDSESTLFEFATPDLGLSRTWPRETNRLTDAHFSPDGKSLYCFDTLHLQIRDAATGVNVGDKLELRAQQAQFAGDDSRLFVLEFGKIQVYDRGATNQLQAWNTGREVDELVVSPDGALVATYASDDKRVAVWDTATAEVVAEFHADDEGVRSATFSGDGKWLLTTGRDEQLKIWSRETWKLRAAFKAHEQDTRSIKSIAGSSLFYTRGEQKYRSLMWLREWDLAHLLQYYPPLAPVVVCGSNYGGGRIDVFDAAGERQTWFENFSQPVASIAFAPDGKLFAAAFLGDDKKRGFRFWSLPDRKEVRRLDRKSGYGEQGLARFSPDGKHLLDGVFDGLVLWRLDYLFDDRLQRDIGTMKDRKIRSWLSAGPRTLFEVKVRAIRRPIGPFR